MIETLYSCGLRISELVNLEIIHVNLRQGVIRVIGKGQKERLVPMGQKLISLVEIYLDKLKENKMRDVTNYVFFHKRVKKLQGRLFGIELKFMPKKLD